MDVAILFLMLASVATMAMDCDEDNSITTESSCWRRNLSFFSLLHKLKENLSEKVSITRKPRESSEWVGEKEGNVPWNLLLESTRWPLMFAFCWSVKEFREEGCRLWGELNEESMRDWMIWFVGRDVAQSCDLPLSFWRYSLIGMRLMIASIPLDGDVLNTSSIQMATLLCIFLRALSR